MKNCLTLTLIGLLISGCSSEQSFYSEIDKSINEAQMIDSDFRTQFYRVYSRDTLIQRGEEYCLTGWDEEKLKFLDSGLERIKIELIIAEAAKDTLCKGR